MTDIAELGLKVDSGGFLVATKSMKDYKSAAADADTTSARLQKRMKEIGQTMGDVGRSASVRLTAPLVAMAGLAVRSFSQFDDAMTQSLAIMGDVSDEMKNEMSLAARQMAKETVFSANQAAESYFFLASAGLDAEQSIAALPQVAKFAQAGMFDMATATDLATDAQSALRLTVDDSARNLENLTRVTDVLVGANTLANASVQQFSEALTNKAGSAMAQLNIEIESGVAVLAAWADQGVKGAEAGERFNIVTRDLQTAFRKNADEFERYGIAVFDAQGNFRNMSDIIQDLEKNLETMSVEQQGATLATLGFQDRSVQAVRSLLGLSGQIKEYEDRLRSMGGVTEEIAENQLKSFSAQLSLTRSRINDVFISIGEGLAPMLAKLNDEANGIIPVFAEWAEKFKDADDGTKRLIVSVGVILASIGPLLILMGAIVKSVATLIPLVKALNAAILLNPFFLLATAIGAAAIAIERKFIPGMEEVGKMAQVVNVLMRAWVILRETMLGVGDVALGLAITVVGAIQAIIAPIEGIVRSAASAMQSLIERDFAGAKDAVMGIGDEIGEAVVRAQQKMDSGVGFMTSSLSDRVNTAISEVNELQTELLSTASAADEAANRTNGFAAMIGQGAGMAIRAFQALSSAAAESEEVIAATGTTIGEASTRAEELEKALRDQIDAIRRQKLAIEGGTRAVLMYELAQAKAEGATADTVARLEELIEEVVRSERELAALERRTKELEESNQGLGFGIQGVVAHLREVQGELVESGKRMQALEDTALSGIDRMRGAFGAFLTGEISSFKDFGRALNQIMEQTLTDMVQQIMRTDLRTAFSGAATDGQGGFTEAGMNRMAAVGAIGSMAGGAIGGRKGGAVSGMAQGAAMGAMFGPWGAVIGAVLGGIAGYFGTEKDPILQTAGRGGFTRDPNEAVRRGDFVDTELGQIVFRFRNIPAEAQEALKEGLRTFDQTLAGILEGTEWLEASKEALVGFQTLSQDPKQIFKERFAVVLGVMDDFTQEIVSSVGDNVEEQIQALTDLLTIKDLVASGEGLGDIGFEDLVRTINELRLSGETLGETFNRVKGAFTAYAELAGSLITNDMLSGLNEYQREMVQVQLDSMAMTAALNEAARASGLEAARAEDLARVHEQTASRMVAVIGRMEEAGRTIAADLFGTELTRLQEEIAAARDAGSTDEDIAKLLERESQIQREEQERQRRMQGQDLAQLVADIAQASGEAFDSVAERMGFDLGQLSELLGFDDEGFNQFLKDLQVDPMAIATEIQGMTDAIVENLLLLPGKFADAFFGRDDETGPPIENPPGPTTPDRRGGGGGTGPNPDDKIERNINSWTGEVTTAVGSLEGALTSIASNQDEVSLAVAAALNNLASSIRASNGTGQTRSSRTRAEV